MKAHLVVRTGRVWLLATTFALALPGCRPVEQPQAPAQAAASPADAAVLDEVWEAFYLKGAKIGHGHTVTRKMERGGTPLVETSSFNHLKIERFGQQVEQDLKLTSLETPEGKLRSFRTEIASAAAPIVVQGRVAGGQLLVDTDTQGQRNTVAIPWSDDIGGFFAVERSLKQAPLKPGQRRKLTMIVPLLNQVAEVELTAVDSEETRLADGSRRLLRIESVATLPNGNSMAETLWADDQGQVHKRLIAAIGQESQRTSREQALADAPAGKAFDLGSDTILKLERPLANAHGTRRVRYRVTLTGGDPSKTFATGTTQQVRSLEPHVAELTVTSVRPGDTQEQESRDDPPAAAYLAANNMLQIDDPRIRQMATEARGTETDPAKVALALERYVNRQMSISDFSQAFSTAAEVAQSLNGDCTEHAVLLAALARVCGIPSRVAIGLVYVAGAEGFGYHMWSEVYLDGRWVPLDATLGQGGIGAAHIKLVDSGLDGASAFSAFLPVAQVLGQLKIDVLDVQ